MSVSAPAAPRRRFPWLFYGIAFAVIVLIAGAPIISVIIASGIADAHGCRLDEGSIHPCLVGGEDWGQSLYAMAMMGWFAIATLPIGFFALVIWLVVVVVHRLLWGRGAKTSPKAVP